MSIGLALLVTLSQAPTSAPTQPAPVPVYAPPGAPAPTQPPPGYVYPQQPYGYPPQYGYGPPPGYPPPSPEDRLEWLEKRHGSRYPGNNGKGMLVGGGLTLGFGALMGLSALTCMVTAAALIDAGDEGAGAITGVAIGTGIATVVLVGTGIPLVIVGKKKRREYRAWLEQQPMSRVRLGFAGGLVLRF